MPAVGEQVVGAESAGGDDHPPGGLPAPLLAQPGSRALAADRVAIRAVSGAQRADLGHLALGLDLDPELLGEPEVVLHQRVLRSVAAAVHAAATAHATRAAGPLAVEEGILDLDPRLVEE